MSNTGIYLTVTFFEPSLWLRSRYLVICQSLKCVRAKRKRTQSLDGTAVLYCVFGKGGQTIIIVLTDLQVKVLVHNKSPPWPTFIALIVDVDPGIIKKKRDLSFFRFEIYNKHY